MARYTQTNPNARTWEVEIQQEMVDVTSGLPRPDPHWEYVDRRGHRHAYRKESPHYPSLVKVVDEPGFVGDDDEYPPLTHLECIACREEIQPGTLPASPFNQYVPGIVSYTLRGFRERDNAAVEIWLEERDLAGIGLFGDLYVQHLLEHAEYHRVISVTRMAW